MLYFERALRIFSIISIVLAISSVEAKIIKSNNVQVKVAKPSSVDQFILPPANGATIRVNPSNYVAAFQQTILPGTTIVLESGQYPRLLLSNLVGTADNWIYVKGADRASSSDPGAVIFNPAASSAVDTLDIRRSNYLVIMNLTVDGRNQGNHGIAMNAGPCSNILIQGNEIKNVSSHQQTVGISTTSAGTVWDIVVRRNIIHDAGTGMYFGNSNGASPFVRGIIEHNLVFPTLGYNMQIKFQNNRTAVTGMPTTDSKTIIRHNVFLKDTRVGTDGARPNVLVGGFPESGLGMNDFYEIYGNFFHGNQTESLLQATGQVAIYNNIFSNSTGNAVTATNHDGRSIKSIYVFNNTIYNVNGGIYFANAGIVQTLAVGNLIVGPAGIRGSPKVNQHNILDSISNATNHFVNSSTQIGSMNLYPANAQNYSNPYLNFISILNFTDANLDFNNSARDSKYIGAYAGFGINPGWQIKTEIKR